VNDRVWRTGRHQRRQQSQDIKRALEESRLRQENDSRQQADRLRAAFEKLPQLSVILTTARPSSTSARAAIAELTR
jgi:hypothetical protein